MKGNMVWAVRLHELQLNILYKIIYWRNYNFEKAINSVSRKLTWQTLKEKCITDGYTRYM